MPPFRTRHENGSSSRPHDDNRRPHQWVGPQGCYVPSGSQRRSVPGVDGDHPASGTGPAGSPQLGQRLLVCSVSPWSAIEVTSSVRASTARSPAHRTAGTRARRRAPASRCGLSRASSPPRRASRCSRRSRWSAEARSLMSSLSLQGNVGPAGDRVSESPSWPEMAAGIWLASWIRCDMVMLP